MGAYDDAAETYLMSGLFPIPIRGKSIPITGATGYEGTVTAEKVAAWLSPDPMVRARAKRGVGIDNIAIRHQLTVAIDVDQGYGLKGGVAQLAAFAERKGLPPLPGTPSSTARGDNSGSRQYVYRIPADVPMKTKPCESVEVCCWHHRFTACYPSIHPTTQNVYSWYLPGPGGVPPGWGARTTQVPRVEAFAVLPAEWFTAFREGVQANADRSALVVDLPDLFATFTPGEPDGLVQYVINKWTERHIGHDEFKNAGIHCLMLGREGHPGVGVLWQLLVSRYTEYLRSDRPVEADREVANLIEAVTVIAQQKPLKPAETVFSGTVFQRNVVTRLDEADVRTADISSAQGEVATSQEIVDFVNTFTAYRRPYRLAKRAGWMADEPHRLGFHSRCLVEGAIAGDYPAANVLPTIATAYFTGGGTDADTPRSILAKALGAILNSKVTA